MKKLILACLCFIIPSVNAGVISPWGSASLKSFDILEQNAGGIDLVVEGSNAFLASERSGLYILDISNIKDVKVKYQLRLSDFGLSDVSLYTVEKHGNYLYCGFRTTSGYYNLRGYIKVVDLTDLDRTGPVVLETSLSFGKDATILGGRVTGLFLSAETNELYAALRIGGIAVIDVSNPADLQLKGIFDPGNIEHQEIVVDVEHKRAYFGGWFRGIGYIDISDPDMSTWHEAFIDYSTESDRYWYMKQRGQYLYAPVADSPSDNSFAEGLAVYDLSENFQNPLLPPKRIGYATIPDVYQCESAAGGKDEGLAGGDPGPHQVLLQDNYALVANGCMGIAVFDISTPENPQFVREYTIPGQVDWPWSLAVSGKNIITVGRNKNFSVNNDVYVFKVKPVKLEIKSVSNAALSSYVLSDTLEFSELAEGAYTISISGGEYSINDGPFIKEENTITKNDTIRIRVQTADDYNVQTAAVVTVGDVQETFSVTTINNAENDSASGAVSLLEAMFMGLFLCLQGLRSRKAGRL